MEQSSTLVFIPLVPLLGAVGAYLLGFQKKWQAGVIATGASILSFLFVLRAFFQIGQEGVLRQEFFSWISILNLTFSLHFDQLTAVMCLVVTGVGSLIHLYATSYMEGDGSVHRFFCYLNLFLFSMLILVMGANLPVLFVGWEGVGLCSYLLIGFWFTNGAFAAAGRKAFVVNRIGDIGLLAGMFLLFRQFGSLDFSVLEGAIKISAMDPSIAPLLTLAAFGFFVGATGKSAQIPLFVWLPDAMAGPTPVSALIHAATMVTAGVYLMARFNFLFDATPLVQAVVVLIAVLTAFIAAFTALTQNDIKKVLAYSTVSQLGFMFMAAGAGVYWVAIFHLVTHAFFKACLFLGAGSVIVGCHHEQDMRHMGGLCRKMPITFVTYLIATLAIAGIAPLSGYYSKHAILVSLSAMSNRTLVPYQEAISILVPFTAFLTAFYMTRSVALTFLGEYRGHSHPHESPWRMTTPLIVLALLAIFGGFFPISSYLEPVLHHHVHAHHESIVSALRQSWVGIVGVGLGLLLYTLLPKLPSFFSRCGGPLTVLSQRKFFMDEVYQRLLVNPLEQFSTFLWRSIDQGLIDGTVNGAGAVVEATGEALRSTQTGQIRQYMLFIFLSALFLIFFYLLMG